MLTTSTTTASFSGSVKPGRLYVVVTPKTAGTIEAKKPVKDGA